MEKRWEREIDVEKLVKRNYMCDYQPVELLSLVVEHLNGPGPSRLALGVHQMGLIDTVKQG